MKKTMFLSLLLVVALLMGTTGYAAEIRNAPHAEFPLESMIQPTVEVVDLGDGYTARIETGEYSSLSRSFAQSRATETTGYKTYTLSRNGQGDLMSVRLDATFVISNETVTCPRYYSDPSIYRDDLVVSYREDDMSYEESGSSARVQTSYVITYISNAFGGQTTVQPNLSLRCDSSGRIY